MVDWMFGNKYDTWVCPTMGDTPQRLWPSTGNKNRNNADDDDDDGDDYHSYQSMYNRN